MSVILAEIGVHVFDQMVAAAQALATIPSEYDTNDTSSLSHMIQDFVDSNALLVYNAVGLFL